MTGRYFEPDGPPHHWIEEGTDEDFRRNVLESDLPDISYAFLGTYVTGFALAGVRGGRLSVDRPNLSSPCRPGRVANPCVEVALEAVNGTDATVELMGTYAVPPGAPMWRALQGAVDRDIHVHDLGRVESSLLQMLMARPELELCRKA